MFQSIGFGAAAPDLPLAQPVPPAAAARPRLVVNGLIRHQDPRLLAPWIVEAALHDDGLKTPKELLVGRAILPLVHARQLLDTPDLAIYVPYGPDTPGSRTLWDIVGALTVTSFTQGSAWPPSVCWTYSSACSAPSRS